MSDGIDYVGNAICEFSWIHNHILYMGCEGSSHGLAPSPLVCRIESNSIATYFDADLWVLERAPELSFGPFYNYISSFLCYFHALGHNDFLKHTLF